MRHKNRTAPIVSPSEAAAEVSNRPSRRRVAAVYDARDTINGLFGTFGLSLVAARLFIPAESAHLGETLWIVQLWLLATAAWLLLSLRHSALARRPDRADLAVWLLAAGHILSALIVVATEGHKRAALNMAWEWGGVAVAVTMLRQWLHSETAWQKFYHLIAVAGIVLSGLGVWQFAVWYPSYRALLTELNSYEANAAQASLSPGEMDRVHDLRKELGVVGAEQDPVARAVLQQRLLSSTEPIGRFALANTLGGLLAAALVLLCGIALSKRRQGGGWLQLIIIGAAVLLVGYCLVLTKSRTAWVGVLAGFALWGLVSARGRIAVRSAARWIAAGGLVVGLLAGLAWWSGALDRLVLSESTKSLKYRVEYWAGTWGVIRTAPLLGVGGTGNFRQHYLGHKLAGSSEEILDPHNFVLDVWVNGGVIALLGLAGVLWWFGSRLRRVGGAAVDLISPTAPCGSDIGSGFRTGAGGIGVCAMLLILLQEWALEAAWDTQLMWLLAGWIVAAWLLPSTVPPAIAIVSAAAAMLIHLLGAGGIAMPAISTPLLLLVLGPAGPGVPVRVHDETHPQRGSLARAAYFARLAAMMVAVVAAFLIPSVSVSLARTYVAAGESILAQRGDPVEARRYFQQAIDEDPPDPEAWHDLAQLDYAVSNLESGQSDAAFGSAMANLQRAIERDPFAPKLRWTAAQWCLARSKKTADRQLAADALAYARSAVAAYPNDAAIRATLAEAFAANGEHTDASLEARRALDLDDLNRQLGHYDRVLSDETLAKLRALSETPSGGSPE